jgi:hypothetical protein
LINARCGRYVEIPIYISKTIRRENCDESRGLRNQR